MNTEKLKKLASTIVNYSIDLKKGDNVNITYAVESNDLVKEIVREACKVDANVFLNVTDSEVAALIGELSSLERVEQLRIRKELELEHTDAEIVIRYNENDYENKNLSKELIKENGIKFEKYNDIRINEKPWVLLNYPSKLDASKAHMTTDEFREFAFDVMTVDYKKMSEEIKPFKELMDKTDKVRIVGPNTDITFSIKGMDAQPCTGERNIPDGEVYSAPVRDSVNGVITYNTPSPYRGNIFHDVSLTFEDGKIIKATCTEDNDKLNEIFDTDEGARYVGEFAFGFNPKILYPMGDILYDEKILGSIHFTPGRCYKDCDNGNKSAIHWDMVLIQRKDFGGGEIYFDDVLIRKDGMFVLDELKVLNYGYDKK